jgi:ABC-type Mn2+/Zn2+ transport system permease subunit
MGGHAASHGSDKGAAFAGLIGGAILIGAILYGITMWTNTQFAGHKAETKAEATK